MRVFAGHIGDTPNLPLSPQELVVVEGRHLVEMNGVNRHHSALSQTGKRIYDDLAARSECDCPVQQNRRAVIFPPDPGCIELTGRGPMRRSPRDDVGLASPRLENGDRKRSRAAEAEQSNALTWLHTGDAQAPKPYDARA